MMTPIAPQLFVSLERTPGFQRLEALGSAALGVAPSAIAEEMKQNRRDRLIIGSMGHLMGSHHGGVSCRWAQKQLDRIFPDLGPVMFDEAWNGQIAMTPDHLPYIYKLADNLFTPIGYNGRGITTGTVFGQALAGLLTGDCATTLPIPVSTMRRVRSAPVMSRFYKLAFAANQWIKSF